MTKTPDEIKKGLECLDRMQFFMGQRAGRELWNEKPHDVQERDLEQYNRDVDMVRVLIRQLEKQNRCLKENKESCEKRMIDLAQRMPEWISMEERLPEDDCDWVLAIGEFVPENTYGKPIISELRKDGKWWGDINDEFPLEDMGIRITHWMHLPQPPKEE